jgi:hypothetical protein
MVIETTAMYLKPTLTLQTDFMEYNPCSDTNGSSHGQEILLILCNPSDDNHRRVPKSPPFVP